MQCVFSAAEDGNRLTPEGKCITDCAPAYSASDEIENTVDFRGFAGGSGGEDYGVGLVIAAGGFNVVAELGVHLNRKHLSVIKNHAQALCALDPAPFKLGTAYSFFKSVIIFNTVGSTERSASAADNAGIMTCAYRIKCRGYSRRSASDNNYVRHYDSPFLNILF